METTALEGSLLSPFFSSGRWSSFVVKEVELEYVVIGRIRLVNFAPSQATAPVDPRVLDAMLPFMTNQYGNPQRCTHAYGWEAEAAVDKS
jgi:hypothetical protein